MRILGVDPGSLRVGFGVIDKLPKMKLGQFGVIEPGCSDFAERLGIIHGEFERLLAATQPDIVVLERVFLGKSVDSAFKLGHARGLIFALAARFGSQVVEYSPREIKKGVTGYGAADKIQVQKAVLSQLSLSLVTASGRALPFDVTDALALALHHSQRVTNVKGPETVRR